MSNSQEIRTGRHCVFNMHVHLVFVAKYRRDVFTNAMLETMREVFERVCLDFEAELIEFDGEHEIKSKLWGNALWSPSYFAASCGGAPIGIIKHYIQQQQTPH